jgi:hypothetical protein
MFDGCICNMFYLYSKTRLMMFNGSEDGKQPTTNRGWETKPGTLAEGRPNCQPLYGARGVDVCCVREGLGTEVERPGLV